MSLPYQPSTFNHAQPAFLCIYGLPKGFVMISPSRIFCHGGKTEKVAFRCYFSVLFHTLERLGVHLACGLWNDRGCPFALGSVGCTESKQMPFCESLLGVPAKSSLNFWFWGAVLLRYSSHCVLPRSEEELWSNHSKHKILPLKVLHFSFQISYCQQRSSLLLVLKMSCPLMNAWRLLHKADGEGADASFKSK